MAKKKGEIRKNGSAGQGATALLGTALILVACIAIFFLADALFPFRRGMPNFFEDYITFKILLSLTISTLSLFLIFVYLKDYLELRNELTLAILFAVISFLLFGISSNPALFFLFGVRREQMELLSVMPMAFAALSLAILAWISSK